MSTIEQKIFDLFSPLPLSLKTKVLALLSRQIAEETAQEEAVFIEEDLKTSNEIRELIANGEMELFSEEEYWKKLKGGE
jgi:hypothetical protein